MSTTRTKTFTIGPACTMADISPSTLRQWEREGLVPKPPRSADGRRQYAPAHVELIREFKTTRRPGRPPASRGEG